MNYRDWKLKNQEQYEEIRQKFITAGNDLELEEALYSFYNLIISINDDDGK